MTEKHRFLMLFGLNKQTVIGIITLPSFQSVPVEYCGKMVFCNSLRGF